MKKHLFGLTAIVLAIAFSAFTNPGVVSKTAKPTLIKYHNWYGTTDGSTVSAILYNNSSVAIDRDQLVNMQLAPCEPASGFLCARGSEDNKSVTQSLPIQEQDSDIEKDVQ